MQPKSISLLLEFFCDRAAFGHSVDDSPLWQFGGSWHSSSYKIKKEMWQFGGSWHSSSYSTFLS